MDHPGAIKETNTVVNRVLRKKWGVEVSRLGSLSLPKALGSRHILGHHPVLSTHKIFSLFLRPIPTVDGLMQHRWEKPSGESKRL